MLRKFCDRPNDSVGNGFGRDILGMRKHLWKQEMTDGYSLHSILQDNEVLVKQRNKFSNKARVYEAILKELLDVVTKSNCRCFDVSSFKKRFELEMKMR